MAVMKWQPFFYELAEFFTVDLLRRSGSAGLLSPTLPFLVGVSRGAFSF